MADDKRNYSNHRIIIEERESIVINGVTEVLSFDEESIVCVTDLGLVVVKGNGLHITRLDLDSEVLSAEGGIDSAEYADEPLTGGGILKKLFR